MYNPKLETAYTFNIEELNVMINQTKEALLQALTDEGLLTRPANEIAEDYAIAVHQPNVFGQWWEKIFGRSMEANKLRISIVKRISPSK